MKALSNPVPIASVVLLLAASPGNMAAQTVPNPVLYVTQVPTWLPSGTVVSIAGAHLASTEAAPRGGALMIRYPDGSLKNLTRAAGYGIDVTQRGPNAIAVRDPCVHWSGTRALFSMVVGAPDAPGDTAEFHWQLYEVVGLGAHETPAITRVPGQAPGFNNIQPCYTSDGRILFVSDRTLDGTRTLYPARDETGGERAVTGLWALDPADGSLTVFDHSPSGSFKPMVDSFGRVVFSRWDHLQRDALALNGAAVDFEGESPGSPTTAHWSDPFPEPLAPSGREHGHTFDLFLPWVIRQDGTGLLTMNHLGRHELSPGFQRARDDSNLVDFIAPVEAALNVGDPTRAGSYLQIAEDGTVPGSYTATDAVMTSVSAGRLVTFDAPPEGNGDFVVPRVSANTGLLRDAHYLANGSLLGSATSGPVVTASYGEPVPDALPEDFIPSEPFRIRVTEDPSSLPLSQGALLTPTTVTTVGNITPLGTRFFSGPLWELQPVEVVARPVPTPSTEPLDSVEASVFGELRVSTARFRSWLRDNDMALLVSRNITARDHRDQQQPYNLYVPGGIASIANAGPAYAVTNVQFFQGDYVRAYKNAAGEIDSAMGRRIASRILHATQAENPATAIAGSTPVAPDGSMAMLVPAGRALTWQLTDPEGKGVVRERYWLTFRAGEIRTCTNCHGNNTADQLGRPPVANPPQALRTLLADFVRRHPEANLTITAYEAWATSAIAPDAPATGDYDRDGLTNLEEFTYGTNPIAPDHTLDSTIALPLQARLHILSGASHARLSFTRRNDPSAPRVSVESSTNLTEWEPVAVISSGGIATPGPVTVTVTASAAQSAAGLDQIDVTATTPVGPSSTPIHYRLHLESP